MVRRLAVAAALAATLATQAPLLDTLWRWTASLLQEQPPTPPPVDDPQPPTGDQGYSIDPDG